jgi:uncharacterized damage-inducible protein DinB
MNDDLKTFYALTVRTRAGVLDWLETLPESAWRLERPDFAYGSLRGIFEHVAGCYLWWVGDVGFGRKASRGPQVQTVQDLRDAFSKVDATAYEALETFTDIDTPFEWVNSRGGREILTKRWLILHPITHEFHHKGQALALARVIGHPHPGSPDTDLVTP